MKVSVVVLNWNGLRHLATCLPALVRQSRPPFQIIVVDNASSDGSVEWTKTSFPAVELVCLSENRGFAGGNAAALERVRGDAVVLLNNDTLPDVNFLKALVECAERNPRAGSIAAHLVDWNAECSDSAGDGCRITGRGFARNRRQPMRLAPATGPVFGACAGAVLYRKEMIDDVGFLDADFFLNFEDTDLSFRAQLFGWTTWFCSEAVVRHRISATQGAWSRINVYYGARNHLWVCVKNFPAWLLMKYGFLIAAEIAGMYLIAARYGRGTAYIAGVWGSIRGLPKMIKKRRQIQRRRIRSVRDVDRLLSPVPHPFSAMRRHFAKAP